MCPMRSVHNQNAPCPVNNLRDFFYIRNYPVIGRRGNHHRLRLRIFPQGLFYLLRQNTICYSIIRHRPRIKENRLQLPQETGMIHGFVAVARHNNPAAPWRRRRNRSKDPRRRTIYQKKSFLRTKNSRRLFLRLLQDPVRRMQIIKTIYFRNIQPCNFPQCPNLLRHIPFMSGHMKRIILRSSIFS